MYGAALYRLRTQEFGELHHIDGVSPACPLAYDDFEPSCPGRVAYQAHGDHGEHRTEGDWSKEYSWPAISQEPRPEQIFTTTCPPPAATLRHPCGIMLDGVERPRAPGSETGASANEESGDLSP